MSINVNTGGLWKEAAPFVRHAGSWKQADAYVRQSGLWYQVSQSGLNLVIDSATPLYDFNLKSWLQNAGLWPSSGPVIIKELRITPRTVITHTQLATRTPSTWGGKSGTPVSKAGYILSKSVSAGQVTSLVIGGGTQFTEYLHDIWAYTPDFGMYAFTTGSGWPNGSRIDVFLVEGTIQGRGGDGAGFHGSSTYDANVWDSGNTTKRLVTNTVLGLKSFMDGWGAVEVTIPVGVFHVGGVVAGGGGGGCYPGPRYFRAMINDPTGLATAEANAANFNINGYHGHTMSPGRRVAGDVPGTPYGAWEIGPYDMFLDSVLRAMHGCGGGQGGSFGGLTAAVSSRSDGSYYYNYVKGVDGGNGTLTAPGGAGTSTVSYSTNDPKMGGVSGSVTGGGIPGAVRGANATHKTDVVYSDGSGNKAQYDVQPPVSFTTTIQYVGEVRYFPTAPLFSKGGASLKGKNLVASMSGNLFGAQK